MVIPAIRAGLDLPWISKGKTQDLWADMKAHSGPVRRGARSCSDYLNWAGARSPVGGNNMKLD